MACAQTLNGLTYDCASSMGGIVAVYIANASDVASVTSTGGVISAVTMADSAKFKAYTFARNTGSLSSNYVIDDTTGAKYVTSDLVLVFTKMESTKRLEITALAQGELAVIVKDANGSCHYLGLDAPVRASAGDGLTGTARGDRNGYSITLQDNSLEMPYSISQTIVDGLL